MMNNGTQNGPAISPAEGSAPTPHVQVLDRSGQVQHSVALTQDGLTAGRRDDHLLALKGDGIGRTHLRIDWDGSRATVTQLSEQHTTWLNQIALRPFEAQVWEVEQPLQVGAYQLRLVAPATPGRRPRPTRINSERIGVAIESGATLTLTPGKSEVVRLKLTNRAKTTDDLHLSIEGIPESWIQFTARVVQVPYGEQKIALTVSIPDEPESRAGPYTVTVYARSGENPDELAGASAYWTIAPFTRCRMEINPSKAYGRRQAAYTIAVWNEGNEPADYKITTGDDTSTLVYDFTPPQITVEPGERQEVNLQVQADRRFTGAPQTYNFSIRATQRGSRVANEQAQFVHQAYVPTWGIPFGATSLFLLLAMLLWLFGTLPGVPRTPQTLALGYARLNPTATATPTVRGAPTASTRTPEATPNNEQETALVLTAVVRSGQTATAVWLGQDDDHDTILNGEEISTVGSLPDARDTDNDGLDDDTEIALGTNPRKSDSDGDGLKDGDEISTGLDPKKPDSDGDGLPDPQDPYTPPLPTPTPTETPTPTSTPTQTPTPTPDTSAQPGDSGEGNSGSGGSNSTTPTSTSAPTATYTPSPVPDNRPPVLGVPGKQTVAEDTALTITGITIDDPDVGDQKLIVRLSTTNGSLHLDSTAGLSFSEGTGNGNDKLVFEGKLADLRTALQRVVYKGNLNFNGEETITLLVDDQGNSGKGGAKTNTRTIEVAVTTVNDLPQVQVNALPSVREGGSATINNTFLVAIDDDNTADELTFTIVKAPTKGTLRVNDRTLNNGSKFTQEDIDDNALTYTNSEDGTSDGFEFTVKDVDGGKFPQTNFPITLSENHPPELRLNDPQADYITTFTEKGGQALIVEPTRLVVNEPDNDLITGATITLTNPKDGEDETLEVTDQGNVTSDYDTKTAVLTLRGADSKDIYAAVLKTARYNNIANSPNTTDRSIRFVIKDQFGESSTSVKTTLHVVRINRPPEIRVNGSLFTYVEDTDAQPIASNAVISDPDVSSDSSYRGAQLSVTIDNAQPPYDQLSIDTGDGIALVNDPQNTITYNDNIVGTFLYKSNEDHSSITINFNGDAATIDVIRLVTRKITYQFDSDSLPADGLLGERTVHFLLTDKDGTPPSNTNEATRRLQVRGVNDPPVLNAQATFALTAIVRTNVNNQGNTVADIIGNDGISDADTGALRGIAITEVTSTRGTWQYLIAGTGTWQIMPINTNQTRVFRLAADDRVRFVPDANYPGPNTEELTFRAWDQSDGTMNGTVGNITFNETTAYSNTRATATLTVN